jgi:trans-2,3-dihydro-3-hydroxyanthranilate isomerase
LTYTRRETFDWMSETGRQLRRTHVSLPSPSAMIASVDVIHTRVFAATPTGGNPCPVVPFADQMTADEMLRLAQRFGLDTAFIAKPRHKDADVAVRYFVPDHEMGISGHATIAAVTVALRQGRISETPIRVETISGTFSVEWHGRDDRVSILLQQLAPAFGAVRTAADVAPALNLPEQAFDLESPIQSVSVSRAKLLIPVWNSHVLDAIKPDCEMLWRLCEEFDVTGFYPFTRHAPRRHADAEARQFPYRAGFPEDAATGVAAGALAAYLARYDQQCRDGVHEVRVAQGLAMGAPSIIDAGAECVNGQITKTFIRGSATIVRSERISYASR